MHRIVAGHPDFPAWMFSQPYLDRLAALYRRQLGHALKARGCRPESEERRFYVDARTGDVPNGLVSCGEQNPKIGDMAWAVEPRWLFASHPPTQPQHLTEDDDAARERTAASEMEWRITTGLRLRLVAAFAGLPYATFAKTFGWRQDGGKSAMMSHILTGSEALSRKQLAEVAEFYGFSAAWFIADRFWDVSCSNPMRPMMKAEPTRLSTADALKVIHAELTLDDLGIKTQAPSWVHPYFLYNDSIERDHTSSQPRLKSLVPGSQKPPSGVPDCTWWDLLAGIGGNLNSGPPADHARPKKKSAKHP